MEGQAKIETFDYIGDDPATALLLKQMRGADGKPTVCKKMWISYATGSGKDNGEGFGKLTVGYGSRQKPDVDGGKIGPEFTFGLTMDAALDEPVLIIKTPRLDTLASQGVRFTDAHSVCAICVPSRYSLLSGNYYFHQGASHPLGAGASEQALAASPPRGQGEAAAPG